MLHASMTGGGAAGGWNFALFVDTVREFAPALDWRGVVLGYDTPELDATWLTLPGLVVLLHAHRRGSGLAPFPADALYAEWRHPGAQFAVLALLVQPESLAHGDIGALLAQPCQRVAREALKLHAQLDSALAAWSNVDLVAALLRIAESPLYPKVRELLAHPFKAHPEVLTLALAQALPESWTNLQAEMLHALVGLFLHPHANAPPVLSALWAARPKFLLQSIITWFYVDPTDARLARILDIVQDLKALSSVLQYPNSPFVLSLAILALARGTTGHGRLPANLVGPSDELKDVAFSDPDDTHHGPPTAIATAAIATVATVTTVTLYTLYGHLQRNSLFAGDGTPLLAPGTLVARGQQIGAVGTPVDGENGGWAPHLHLQVCTEADLGGRVGYYTGACRPGDWPAYAALTLDPNLILSCPFVARRGWGGAGRVVGVDVVV
jgi:hypothetical protein